MNKPTAKTPAKTLPKLTKPGLARGFVTAKTPFGRGFGRKEFYGDMHSTGGPAPRLGGPRGVGLVLFQLRVRSEQAADGLGIGYVLRTDPAL